MFKAENASANMISETYQQQVIHFKDQVDVVFELQNALKRSV